MLGALECELDSGLTFKIGSGFNDVQRSKPPKIGSRVTFKYMGVSEKGRPRFPIYVREHPGI
jgi:DNA ligase-1